MANSESCLVISNHRRIRWNFRAEESTINVCSMWSCAFRYSVCRMLGQLVKLKPPNLKELCRKPISLL